MPGLFRRHFPRLLVALAGAAVPGAARAGKAPPEFTKDVRPLLAEHCFRCHGPDKQEAFLRLDVKKELLSSDDEDVPAVAANMASLGVRRLPVVDKDKRLIGIVALSNIAQSGNRQASESLLDGVAQPH